MKSTQLAFNPMRMGHFDYLFPQCTNLKYSVKCALYYLYKKDYSQVQEDEPNFFYSWIVTKMLYPELKDSEVEKRAQNTTTEQDEINRGIVYMLQSLTTINKKIASCSKDPSTKVEDKTLDAYEFILNKFNGRLEKYLETSDLDKNLLQPIFEAAKMAAGNVKTAIETYRALQSRKPATPEEIKARCTGFSDKQISGSVYNQGGSPYSGTNSNSFHNNGHKVNVTADEHKKNLLNKSSQSVWKL